MSLRPHALAAILAAAPLPALSQTMPGMADMPVQSSSPPAKPDCDMDMSGMDMSTMDMSGCARDPWQVHVHGTLNLVADDQSAPRGRSKIFASGMMMIMAERAFGHGNRLSLDAMLSPDPFMGRSGYPLLLQSGETADGVTPLVDRQHPHDLVMGLTARLTHDFAGGSAYVEAGYPGEIAFGPMAFMHRPSGDTFPTAPISHHWLDSGHITMGEITAGVSAGPLTFEASRFTGREPDQNRFDLDPVRLDSSAARITWRISGDMTAQASWARQTSPEQLEPDIDLDKSSVSFAYGHDFAAGRLDSTLAWGRKQAVHGAGTPLDAYLFENTFRFRGPWVGLLRYERAHNDELAPGAWWVAKTEFGAVRTFALGRNVSLGLGAVRQFSHVPEALKPTYGSHPDGTVVFAQLRFMTM